MDKEYFAAAQREIQEWESEGPGYLTPLTDLVFLPVANVAKVLIPAGVQRAVGKATYEVLLGLNSATQLFNDEESICRKVDAAYCQCGDEFKAADSAAQHYRKWNMAYAAGEGGATGAVGLLGLAADIPALIAIALRLIRQIGTCYGYDMNTDPETEHSLHVLRVGSAPTLKAKMDLLVALKEIQYTLVRLSLGAIGESLARNELGRLSVLAAIRQFAERLGVQLTTRKALALVPVVGALIGGSFNALFVNDVGRAAYMAYRRRRIAELQGSDSTTRIQS
jgi:uncharacterized protein (DUF697 family)